MGTEVLTGWQDVRSYITKKDDLDKKLSFQGVYYLNGAEFRFYINEQKTGKYLLRGRITAISPVDGFALQVTGLEKKRRLEKLKKENTGEKLAHNLDHRNKALNISSEFYCQSTDEADVKRAIVQAVTKLYAKNADLILRRKKQTVKPDTVTPAVAAMLYAKEFVSLKHRKTKEQTQRSYEQWLISFCGSIPNVPMANYKKV